MEKKGKQRKRGRKGRERDREKLDRQSARQPASHSVAMTDRKMDPYKRKTQFGRQETWKDMHRRGGGSLLRRASQGEKQRHTNDDSVT